jgi:AAA family ATP:ADP antiporter
MIHRLIDLRKGEGKALILSGAYFFFLLCSYYLLRPVREAMGIQRGYDTLPWLMTGTMIAMLAVNPLFAALVSRVPRKRFIPLAYHFFAANMLVFYGLFQLLPSEAKVGLGYAFYIWLSVFNLFVVSIFWAFMTDVYSHEQSKRLFGMIGVGGTLGAILGAAVTRQLVDGVTINGEVILKFSSPTMLLVAIVPLELAVLIVRPLMRSQLAQSQASDANSDDVSQGREPGPGIMDGLKLLGRSRYLQLISLYILAFTITSTLLYLEQARIVAMVHTGNSQRTAAFANIDFWANSLTLFVQLFITSRILRWLGIGGTLVIVPILTLAGFAILWANPVMAVLVIFQTIRRGLHYAVDRPAREVLYTIVTPDERYKAKPIIDTFIYRTGDVLGTWLPTWFRLVPPAIALPVSAIWIAAAWSVGWLHRMRLAAMVPPAQNITNAQATPSAPKTANP